MSLVFWVLIIRSCFYCATNLVKILFTFDECSFWRVGCVSNTKFNEKIFIKMLLVASLKGQYIYESLGGITLKAEINIEC